MPFGADPKLCKFLILLKLASHMFKKLRAMLHSTDLTSGLPMVQKYTIKEHPRIQSIPKLVAANKNCHPPPPFDCFTSG